MDENTTNKQDEQHDVVPPAADADNHVTRTAVDLEKESTNSASFNERLASIESGALDTTDDANEPSEPARVADVAPVAVPVKRSHKGLVVALTSVLAVVVLAGGGAAGWYYTIRTPDSQYEKASALVAELADTAKEIESAKSSVKKSPAANVTTASIRLADDSAGDIEESLAKLKDAKVKAADYQANLEELSKLEVLTSDPSVNALYESSKKTINEFGSSADTLYKTGLVFMTMMDRCFSNGELSEVDTLKNLDEYDAQIKQCEDYLKANKTVVAGEFSNMVFEPYRDVLLKLISYTRTLFTAKDGSMAQAQAVAGLKGLNNDLKKIDTSKIDEIELTQSPQKKLTQLKDKIDERQKVLFR